MVSKIIILGICSFLLCSCAGYKLGGATPQELQSIKSIAIPQFENDTLEPRLAVLTTNSTVDSLVLDGSYKIVSNEEADAVLLARVKQVDYHQFRSNRFDTLRSDEFTAIVEIDWKLVSGRQVLSRGTSKGSINFFTERNFQASKRNALPLAAKRAADKIVTSLTEGF